MSAAVIASNTSIKIASFSLSQSVAPGANQTLYAALTTEYLDLRQFASTGPNLTLFISYLNSDIFIILASGVNNLSTNGTANKIILPPGAILKASHAGGLNSTVLVSGVKHINSP